MRIFSIAVVIAAFSALGFAQASPVCAVSGVPTQLRAESYTDFMGDVIITCTGGAPTASGNAVPSMTVTLTINGVITSKITDTTPSGASAFTEALLLVDGPNTRAGLATTSTPVLACGQNTGPVQAPYDTGNPGVCTIQANGAGGGVNGTTYNGSSGHPNVFQGRLVPNSGGSAIQFIGVPFDPPASGDTLTMRITNIRVNAVGISGGGPVYVNYTVLAQVSVTNPNLSFPNTQVVAGIIRNGLLYPPTTSIAGPYPQCGPIPTSAGTISITEGFASSFKAKNWAPMQANGMVTTIGTVVYNGGAQLPAHDLNQNVAGALYTTESGFMFPGAPATFDPSPNPPPGRLGQGQANPNSVPFPTGLPTGIDQAGIVSNGTRLAFVFSNIPAGSNATVPNVVSLVNAQAGSGNPAAGVMVAVTGADAQGAGGTLTTTGVTALSESGVTTVVYEVLYADPNIIEEANVPVTLNVTSGAPQLNQAAQANVNFAPFYAQNAALNPGVSSPLTGASSLPIARFFNNPQPLALWSFRSCGPDLTIATSHTGNFTQGETGATYSVNVRNVGGAATSGTVTVTDTVFQYQTLVSISGTGWNCVGTTCTRSDALAAGAAYPAITVTVNIAQSGALSVGNTAVVSGGGDTNSGNNSATDSATVNGVADLTLTATHTGNFTLGQAGAIYTIIVTNSGGAATAGTVIVGDTLPTGLTLVSMAGTGWTCQQASCARSDALAGLSSYPPITVTVNVALNAPLSVTNAATVAGGGEVNTTNDAASDPTTITVKVPTKVGIFRASGFLISEDSNGNIGWDPGIDRVGNFGIPGDVLIFGDWDGSGLTKVGIYRPSSSLFALDMNGNGQWDPGIDVVGNFGQPGDAPIVGDWTGDGRTKIGIYRASNGQFALDINGNLAWDAGTDTTGLFGAPNSTPVVGDWTGTGVARVGVFVNGQWTLDSNGNLAVDASDAHGAIGAAGDTPILGDWNGDGRTKVGIYRPSNSMFGLDYNGNLSWDTGTDRAGIYVAPGDVPIVGDWTGTGVSRIGIYRGGYWALDSNGNIGWDPGTDSVGFFGIAGDQAIVGKW